MSGVLQAWTSSISKVPFLKNRPSCFRDSLVSVGCVGVPPKGDMRVKSSVSRINA